MEQNSSDWCTVESDPGVFTTLIQQIGVKNVQVEELFSLDDKQTIDALKPIYGLVFLFKWTQEIKVKEHLDYYDQDLFFANQVITNACATQALLSILLNCPQNVDIGEELSNFKEFTKGLDSQMKGLAISNSDKIRLVHNSFAKKQPFIYSKEKNDSDETQDAFHFISYIPFKGRLYELDGLQKGPILLGQYQGEDGWLDLAKQEISTRIQKYQESEIRFNLMAVIADKCHLANNEMSLLQSTKLKIFKHCIQNGIKISDIFQKECESLNESMMIDEKNQQITSDIKDSETANQQLENLNFSIQHQQDILLNEQQKQLSYKQENQRRQHNYIPFILELLKMTAQKGKLEDLIAQGRKKKEEKDKKKQEKKDLEDKQKQQK